MGKIANKRNIWPKLTKYAYFGPNLAVFVFVFVIVFVFVFVFVFVSYFETM